MKFKTFIENCVKYAKEHPETLEMDVVYSKDDEGNGFGMIHYNPCVGLYEDREFTDKDAFDDWDVEGDPSNAVCIN